MLPEKVFALLQQLLPKHALSRLTGLLAECKIPAIKNRLIKTFAEHYDVDLSQAVIEDPEQFAHFNDFFTRALKPGQRQICADEKGIASPADGAVSELGNIELGCIMQAKGQHYSLMDLVAGDVETCETYLGGTFATIYLSPKDYHRVHMPLDGELIKTTYVPGELFSVNQATANQIPGVFARNERLICHFESAQGPFVVILVGAMIVAGIETVWAGHVAPVKPRLESRNFQQQEIIKLKKGDEMGRFKLGSTAILLFPEGAMRWDESLENGSPLLMGENIGSQV